MKWLRLVLEFALKLITASKGVFDPTRGPRLPPTRG